jgi:hypothetical protein
MLKKPNNYENVQLNEDFIPIELGGHKGVIKSAEVYTSDFSGKTSLKVCIDTAKDDKQPEYFAELYKNDDRENKKWSSSAIRYVSLGDEENQVKQLKSFITAVENSNPGFTYDWDKEEKTQLKDKKIGLVFGLEEYKDNEGNIKTARKLTQFRSVDKVDNVKIPKVKKLDGSLVEYEDYTKGNNTSNKNDAVEIVLSEGELPF